MAVLARIERRYRLPAGHFKNLLPHPSRSTTRPTPSGLDQAEMRRLAWHLPDDFGARSPRQRLEIVEWIRTNVLGGTTDYRRFQAAALQDRYALKFQLTPGASQFRGRNSTNARKLRPVTLQAPRALQQEMRDLVDFKTATLTTLGFGRNGTWCEETALQRVEHLGLVFGALVAAPDSKVAGLGLPASSLTLALLAFPSVWDWYLDWRSRRRGFFTGWEADLLQLGLGLMRPGTGWLSQSPQVAIALRPVSPLVSREDVEAALRDWPAQCEEFCRYARKRSKEIARVARVHRDPFEAILPVLEADSPLGEYRKITEEIARRIPDRRRYPRAAAEATRAFLMLRLGLHLGVRQRNLRELLVCPRGSSPRSERELENLRRGEIRWLDGAARWEVVIPSIAFKNGRSSFFGNKPFRLLLPDLGGLYGHLEAYIRVHRKALLKDASDPGTLFVKTTKRTSRDAAYDKNNFYQAWALAIQRYGIRNPYTGRGAVAGLLPHGPHSVRDVLATHILKETGSFEQASYAIQDTPEMVAKHYGRFLPENKAALAAEILNRAWA